MVLFALCASKKQNTVNTQNNSGDGEVLYELMDLDTRPVYNNSINTTNSLTLN